MPLTPVEIKWVLGIHTHSLPDDVAKTLSSVGGFLQVGDTVRLLCNLNTCDIQGRWRLLVRKQFHAVDEYVEVDDFRNFREALAKAKRLSRASAYAVEDHSDGSWKVGVVNYEY